MRQVIIVSLGNNAYNIDEDGYRALQKYLDRASAGLKENPDAAEILGDLERGIGEKCASTLSASKNVVSAEDVDRILREIGPVDGAATEEPGVESQAPPEGQKVKVLRRRIHGSSIAGVCTGLADYFGVDVLIVRLAFVGLSLLSGAGLVMYIIMAFVVPSDGTAGAPGRLAPSKIALLVVIAILFIGVSSVFFNEEGMGLRATELLTMMVVTVTFFGTIALILAGAVFLVIRYLRSSTR